MLTARIVDFILTHDQGHLRAETLDWLKGAYDHPITNDLILVTLYADYALIAVSACCIKDKTAQYSLTVVHKSYRNMGHGTIASRIKLDLLKWQEIASHSWVAEDNLASKRMLEKIGLKPVCQEIRTRRDDQEYIAILMS